MAKHAAPVSILSWSFLVIGLGLFGLAGLGWSNHLADDGVVVAKNVTLAGAEAEDMTSEQAADLVSIRAEQVLDREVVLDYGAGELSLTYGDLGFTYDEEATTAALMEARHEGSPWDQFASWVIGELVAKDIDETWSFDPGDAETALDDHPGLTPVVVEEPRIESDGSGAMVVTPGIVGTEADIDDFVDQLAGVDLVSPPERLGTEAVEIQPTVSDAAADAEAERLNDVTGNGVQISVEGRGAIVSSTALQSLMSVEVGNGEIQASIDGAGLQERVEATISGPVGTFVEPSFDVGEDDTITVVVPGVAPPVCCQTGMGDWLGSEILSGSSGPFQLQSRPADDPALLAWADGSAIVEKVGEFTTPHACCEARVQNIHRIADIVRGIYLIPGETLSLNQFVGPRTVENGFVPAGAIRQGHLISEIGGGVSQFATTIFNAAYFAGLDFVEYRSHSLYFTRYPYGREATISNPAPDLVMTNTTDYPVLIWTSYTGESITVSMYSTQNVQVDELGQRTSRRGSCTHVETDRQRTYSDGRTVVDTILADYRPAEGIDCNGNPIPPPTT